jgi:hypothetical protein
MNWIWPTLTVIFGISTLILAMISLILKCRIDDSQASYHNMRNRYECLLKDIVERGIGYSWTPGRNLKEPKS